MAQNYIKLNCGEKLLKKIIFRLNISNVCTSRPKAGKVRTGLRPVQGYNCPQNKNAPDRGRSQQICLPYFTKATSFEKVAGSFIARSARIFRSRPIPFWLSLWIKAE